MDSAKDTSLMDIDCSNGSNLVLNNNGPNVHHRKIQTKKQALLDPYQLQPGSSPNKGDRTTFLKRLGKTNKNLYEEYLAFKKQQCEYIEPRVPRKIIIPTIYKKNIDSLAKVKKQQKNETTQMHQKSEETKNKTSLNNNKIYVESIKSSLTRKISNNILDNSSESPVSQIDAVITEKHMDCVTEQSNETYRENNLSSFGKNYNQSILPTSFGTSDLLTPYFQDNPPRKSYSRSNASSTTQNPLVVDHMNPVVKLVRWPSVNDSRSRTVNTSPLKKSTLTPATSPIIVNAYSILNATGSDSKNASQVKTKKPIIIKPTALSNGNIPDKYQLGVTNTSVNHAKTNSPINGTIRNSVALVRPALTSRPNKITLNVAQRDKSTMVNNTRATKLFEAKLGRIRKKNEVLRMKVKALQSQLNEKRKPLHLQVDKIAKEKEDGNSAQAVFLMEQIDNFNKMKRPFSLESMTIFSVLFMKSRKAYQFLNHHSLLSMPCKTTIKRFLQKDGNCSDKLNNLDDSE